MVDKITFLETLHSVQEIVKASPEPLTKEEIRGYFQDMELSKEQQEMVYRFLLTPPEEPKGTTEGPEPDGEEKSRAKAKSWLKAFQRNPIRRIFRCICVRFQRFRP